MYWTFLFLFIFILIDKRNSLYKFKYDNYWVKNWKVSKIIKLKIVFLSFNYGVGMATLNEIKSSKHFSSFLKVLSKDLSISILLLTYKFMISIIIVFFSKICYIFS